MLLSVLICFYGKKISVSEFLRSARSSFLLFSIKKENRQRLYNLLSIFILKLIYFYVHIDNFIYFRCHVFAILHKKRTCIPCALQCIHYTLLYTACLLSYDSDCTERISVECRGYLDTGLLCAGMYYHSVSDIYSAVLYRAVSIEKYVSRLKT